MVPPVPVWKYLRLLPDDPGITDRQPVEQVHQDNHHQEDETQEEDVREGGQGRIQIKRQVTINKFWQIKTKKCKFS